MILMWLCLYVFVPFAAGMMAWLTDVRLSGWRRVAQAVLVSGIVFSLMALLVVGNSV